MNCKKRFLSLFLCILLSVTMLPVKAYAAGTIDPEEQVTLTLTYRDGDQSIFGAEFQIYKVADVDEYARMTKTEDFDGYPFELEDNDPESWQYLAETLRGYILRDRDLISPEAVLQIGEDGTAETLVMPGLYLVIGNRKTIDEVTYMAVPFMVFLPGCNTEEDAWDYEVKTEVKYTKADIPSDEPEVVTRKVLKIWQDAGYEEKRPESVIVQLLCDGSIFDTQILCEENHWRYSWDNLDGSHEWLLVEKEQDSYAATIMLEGITFTVTNRYLSPYAIEDPPVAKKITGEVPRTASTFRFVLTALDRGYPMPEGSTDGQKEVSITGEGSTEFGVITFTGPGIYTYRVEEKNTGISGYIYDSTVYTITYTVTLNGKNLSVARKITDGNGKEAETPVFTNRYSAEATLPNTGMVWWPVPVSLAAGLLLCILGILRMREEERMNRK